jgi:hypothetical protein
LLQFFNKRLRTQVYGLLDTKAGGCPTPIFPLVAKGHALPCPARSQYGIVGNRRLRQKHKSCLEKRLFTLLKPGRERPIFRGKVQPGTRHRVRRPVFAEGYKRGVAASGDQRSLPRHTRAGPKPQGTLRLPHAAIGGQPALERLEAGRRREHRRRRLDVHDPVQARLHLRHGVLRRAAVWQIRGLRPDLPQRHLQLQL